MFTINEPYKRSQLHDQFGGNRQKGISNCKNNPYIFIFSGKSGKTHGYNDSWDEHNYYHYSGEGQSGDMVFKAGNKSLLNHQKDGKRVFLFESDGKGYVRYEDELELVDHYFQKTHDTSGVERLGIRFKFKSVMDSSKHHEQFKTKEIDYNVPNETERKGLVTTRVGQGSYRKRLLHKWDNKCAITGIDIPEILIASHIKPWATSDKNERYDVENGIILSPVLDALFDKHLISFDKQGKIIISKLIKNKNLSALGINTDQKLAITPGMKKYLEDHRETFFTKQN